MYNFPQYYFLECAMVPYMYVCTCLILSRVYSIGTGKFVLKVYCKLPTKTFNFERGKQSQMPTARFKPTTFHPMNHLATTIVSAASIFCHDFIDLTSIILFPLIIIILLWWLHEEYLETHPAIQILDTNPGIHYTGNPAL